MSNIHISIYFNNFKDPIQVCFWNKNYKVESQII